MIQKYEINRFFEISDILDEDRNTYLWGDIFFCLLEIRKHLKNCLERSTKNVI
jgi:hypothetical protein